MGWKAIQEHYKIEHTVHVVGDMICIGSPYVSKLITIKPDGTVEWGAMGASKNNNLSRYYAEMTCDKPKLRELISCEDRFSKSTNVYTYDGGSIIKKRCEKIGWPNCTHDGEKQFNNTHFANKKDAVLYAKEEAGAAIKNISTTIDSIKEKLAKFKTRHQEQKNFLAKLQADYP